MRRNMIDQRSDKVDWKKVGEASQDMREVGGIH